MKKKEKIKKTAVFHYTQSGKTERGEEVGGLGKHTDWPRSGCISKHCLHFLKLLLISCRCSPRLHHQHWAQPGLHCTRFCVRCVVVFVCVWRLTHRAEGAHAVAVLSVQVFLVTYGAHAIGSRVAIETTACGTKHGHRALVRLLGHC